MIAEKKVFVNENLSHIHMKIAQKIARNMLLQIGGKIISVMLAIFAIALLTRSFLPEQFGWYVTAMTFLQFFAIVADGGLVLITSQMLAQHKHDQTNILNNLFSFRFVTALFMMSLAPLLVLAFPYGAPIKQAVFLCSFMFFFIALQQIFTGLFQKHLAMQWSVIAEIIGRITLLFGIGITTYFHLGFLPTMFAITIANIIQFVMLYCAGLRYTRVTFAYNPSIWKEIVNKSYPLTFSIFFNMIYLRADILILSLIRSQHEVGLYGAAYKILDVLTQIPIMFMGLMIPLITSAFINNNIAKLTTLIQKSAYCFLIVGMPLIAGGIILATPLMKLVAGDAFASSGIFAQILFLALIGAFIGALYGHIIVALNEQKKTIRIYMYVAIFGLLLYIIVIPYFGALGAAWITVVCELLAGILLARFVHTKTNISFPITIILLKTSLATIIMCAVIIALSFLHVLILVCVGIIVYITTMYILKIISPDEIRLLFQST